MRRILAIATLLFVFSVQKASAAHLVGGELTYECLTNFDYLVKLKVYRNCNCTGCAGFDDPAYIFIYDDAFNLVSTLTIPFPGSVQLPAFVANPCLTVPPDVCVEEAVYTSLVNLPPVSGGYELVYQRCCRTNSILNIDSPDSVGSTYYTHIPDPALSLCNSSPYFNDFPPIVMCVGDVISFDHSATDIDGDSLVYELCTPYSGASTNNYQPTPGQPPPPPPYGFVTYIPPYSFNAPLNGSPGLSIDAQTGILTGTPITPGQFVVGVCVSEYKNGFLMSTNKRDFQFNVLLCNSIVIAATPSFVKNCDDTVNFVNLSSGGTFYEWDFGDGMTSTEASPSHGYPDTGSYTVSLIVNGGWPCADTAYSIVNIYPDMKADFSYTIHCADSTITFTDLSFTNIGSITDWIWDYGDWSPLDSVLNGSHLYSQGGVYTVTHSVVNDIGCISSKSREIYVYEVPQPMISVIPQYCVDSPITFLTSVALDSSYITSWYWEVEGDSAGTLSDLTYVFDSVGTFELSLFVMTNHGCIGSDTGIHNIYENPEPVILFSDSPCIGSPLTFNDGTQLNNFSIDLWIWSIDGNATSFDSSLTYTFSAGGSYEITLYVESVFDCGGSITQTYIIDSCFFIGVEKLAEDAFVPFTVNPNPSKGQFRITSLNETKLSNFRVEVYEATGRLILMMSGAELEETNRTIDLRDFGSGIYFLKLLEGTQTYSLRLVVH